MAKRGLFVGNITPFLKDKKQQGGWSLCIGAGTSLPMFPDWNTLVERIIALDVGQDKSHDISEKMLKAFSPDSLIQAAQDRLNLSAEQYFTSLSNELYCDLKNNLSTIEWDLFTEMVSSKIGDCTLDKWAAYLNLIQDKYPTLSALQIADVVTDTFGTTCVPNAILSFNAEPLLPSLINAFIITKQANKNPPVEDFKTKVDLITHSISNRKTGRIPYYFIHGLLPVPSKLKKQRMIDAVDKLIFSESEYLQMANTTFSWQSTVFLDISSTQPVVFIGVSLADPNMRRWLSWIHENRMKELKKRNSSHGPSTLHYWITKRPVTSNERSWIESSVEHLGVRLIWVNEWDEVGRALRSMIGIN